VRLEPLRFHFARFHERDSLLNRQILQRDGAFSIQRSSWTSSGGRKLLLVCSEADARLARAGLWNGGCGIDFPATVDKNITENYPRDCRDFTIPRSAVAAITRGQFSNYFAGIAEAISLVLLEQIRERSDRWAEIQARLFLLPSTSGRWRRLKRKSVQDFSAGRSRGNYVRWIHLRRLHLSL